MPSGRSKNVVCVGFLLQNEQSKLEPGPEDRAELLHWLGAETVGGGFVTLAWSSHERHDLLYLHRRYLDGTHARDIGLGNIWSVIPAMMAVHSTRLAQLSRRWRIRVSSPCSDSGSLSRRGNTKLVILMAVLQCQSRGIFYASGFREEPTAVLLCTLRQTLLPTV